MEDKIKLILNKVVYDKLGLDIIEQEIVNANIRCKDIINDDNVELVSRYFFLLNDVYLDRLNSDEVYTLENYIENIDFHNIILTEELRNFIDERLFKLLIPDTDERYISYYGTGNNYIAPSDSIVLGFHYIKYLDNEDNVDNQEEFIYEKMNYIQSVLAPSKNIKVSVLVFDELIKDKSKLF